MMTPELSHRIARALAVENPPPDRRFEINDAVAGAAEFRQLPIWVQQFIQKAERKI